MNFSSSNPAAEGLSVHDGRASSEVSRVSQARWFREEVEPHEPALRTWLQSAHPHLHDIDDIVQEAYLRIIRARDPRRIACVRTYLFGIARHVALDAYRKQRRTSEIEFNSLSQTAPLQTDSIAIDTIEHGFEFELALEAIKTLPPRCREIVMLRANDGLSYQQIAERLSLAEETVRVQVARGIKRCHQYLRERGLNKGGS